MRVALVLTALLGLAAVLVAGLYFFGGSAGRAGELPTRTSGPAQLAEPLQDLGSGPARVEPSVPRTPDQPEPIPDSLVGAAENASAHPSRQETAFLFRVVDARSGKALSTFEVRLGQHFMRPLLDAQGRIQHEFPEGRVRFAGVVEASTGEDVELSIAARGYQELRVPALYVTPGHELDLGTLRLERAPRLEVLVLDDRTGEPVAGARVRLLFKGAVPQPDSRPVSADTLDPFQARTERDGRVLLGSRPGEQATLFVRHPSYAALDTELSLPLSEQHEVSVRLLAPEH